LILLVLTIVIWMMIMSECASSESLAVSQPTQTDLLGEERFLLIWRVHMQIPFRSVPSIVRGCHSPLACYGTGSLTRALDGRLCTHVHMYRWYMRISYLRYMPKCDVCSNLLKVLVTCAEPQTRVGTRDERSVSQNNTVVGLFLPCLSACLLATCTHTHTNAHKLSFVRCR
jgi:hypothetical protein